MSFMANNVKLALGSYSNR